MNQNILVVGCGSIGERHLRCLLRTGRARAAACDSNPALLQRMIDEYQVPGYPTLEAALCDERYSGVVICTPAHTHLALASTCIKTGAGVLIEKPLSVSLDGADELRAQIESARVFAGVAYVYHFMPWVQGMQRCLKAGHLGRPLHATVTAGQHFPTFRPAYREIYYARRETGGGIIQDALTHLANAMEWMLGPTTQLFCDASHQILEGVEVEDTVNVCARNGDILVNYSMNQFQEPNEATVQVHCERGSVKFESHGQRWSEFDRELGKWTHHVNPPLERDDVFTAQSAAFLDALSGKETPICSYDEALQTLKFNLAAMESASSGRLVSIR